jgi:CxxC motif-containing protein (DUF1111 family)
VPVSVIVALVVLAVLMPEPAAAQARRGDLAARGFGEPISGLSADEAARFAAGREVFVDTEDASDGLGPVFNEDSCGACHGEPAVGGGSRRVETRFGRSAGGTFDPLERLGGSLLQDRGIGAVAECQFSGEAVPAQANVRAGRRTTSLFGLGLVDAVPDATLVALAERQRTRTPATAGRARTVLDAVSGEERIGRFGWKAQVPSLLHFAGDAYLGEMGITSPFFPDETCPQGDCESLRCDPVPDPEDDGADLFLFADFMAMLAPPPRAANAGGRAIADGRRTFERIGCADCHAPSLRSGPSDVAALANRRFAPYSDFLLHDMGVLGDGVAQAGAGPREMRTAPLWGLRTLDAFLHDGRASTIEQAILAHDGQGAAARDRFRALLKDERSRLLRFLRSL